MADFAITSHGSALYFLSGELDVATVPLMEVAIEDAVARGGPITLDMTDVTFADSSGIGAIMKRGERGSRQARTWPINVERSRCSLEEVHNALREIAQRRRVSLGEALRDALAQDLFILREADSGGKILIKAPNKPVRQLVVNGG